MATGKAILAELRPQLDVTRGGERFLEASRVIGKAQRVDGAQVLLRFLR